MGDMVSSNHNLAESELRASEPDNDEPAAGTVRAAATETTPRESSDAKPPPRRLAFSLPVQSVIIAVLVATLTAGLAMLGLLYIHAESQFDAVTSQDSNNAHAEQVALDYAVNAAVMDYKDISQWKTKLVAGTTPELTDKLTKAATSMEQILTPLEWVSTARPLAAKVQRNSGGTYVVDSFVSVQTKTIQSPEALQSTATYQVTIDSTKGWQISDVGGIGSALEGN